MKTRATQLKAPGQIVLVERELTVGPEEVLVKGHLSGVCGSDKAMYRGDIPEKIRLATTLTWPRPPRKRPK